MKIGYILKIGYIFNNLNSTCKGIVLSLMGFSAFAVADVCAKWLGEHYGVLEIVAGINVISGVILLILSPLLGGFKRTFETKQLRIHIARGVCNTITSILVVLSFSKLPLAFFYSLIFAAPFLITLLAIPVYKDRVCNHGWHAIAAGFIGVLIVLRPGFVELNGWLFLPLLAAIFVACFALLARALNEEETLLSLALFPVSSNIILITPMAFSFFFDLTPLHFAVFLLAGSMVIIGITSMAVAFRIAKPSVVSPFHYIQMIWAIVLGYFIFNEVPDVWTIVGAVVIIGSGVYLIENERSAMKYEPDYV